ncbi:MAG: DUF11 domain-containing protein [bacterium]|nr:DUF11 domain-containing protein [bacterium]
MKTTPLLALAILAGVLVPACAELEGVRTQDEWHPQGSQQVAYDEYSETFTDGAPVESSDSFTESGVSLANAPSTRITSLALPSGNPATSALLMTKSVPARVICFEEFTYDITVENLTAKPLNNVILEERLPDSLSIVDSEPAIHSYEDGVANWKLGTLEAGATRTVTITGRALADGLATSRAFVDYESPLTAEMRAVSPRLSLEVTIPEAAIPGDPFEIELTLNNWGPVPARNVDLSALLPEGLQTESGESSAKMVLPELAPDASHTMTIAAAAIRPGSFAPIAEASMPYGEPITVTGSTIQVRDTRLELTTTGPDKLFLGQPGKITLTVKNAGYLLAKDVKLNQPIPAGLKLDRVTHPVKQLNNNLSWSLGNMEPGAKSIVTFYLTPTKAGVLDISATAQAVMCTPAESSFSATMEGISALRFTVEDLQDPVVVGEACNYLLKVHNQGTAAGSNMEVVVTLAEGMRLVHAKGPTGGHTKGNKILFDTLESLDPGATATWRLAVKSQQAGNLQLSAALKSEVLGHAVEVTQSTQFDE